MKKVIVLIILLISIGSNAQSGFLTLKSDSLTNPLSQGYSTSSLVLKGVDTTSEYFRSTNFNFGTNKLLTTNRFLVFNRDVTKVMVIARDGTIYYTPKYFCRCKSCLKSKGMKKLKIKY